MRCVRTETSTVHKKMRGGNDVGQCSALRALVRQFCAYKGYKALAVDAVMCAAAVVAVVAVLAAVAALAVIAVVAVVAVLAVVVALAVVVTVAVE